MELLNPTNTSPLEEAESEVVKKLLGCKASDVDEIYPQMKAQSLLGLRC